MGLFKPVWMTSDFNKRNKALDAVRSMTNQRELEQVALKAPIADVAGTAVEKISDPLVLRDLALKAPKQKATDNRYTEIACYAASQIWDRNILYGLALDPVAHPIVRATAVNGLDDQPLFRSLLLDANAPAEAKAVAMRKVDDTTLVDGIVVDRSYADSVRKEAVARCENQQVLASVACGDDVRSLREAALARCEDQNAIAKIALADEDHEMRRQAIEKLEDPEALEKLARDELDHFFRHAALEKIDDAELRADIEASWSEEQRSKDSYEKMLADGIARDIQARNRFARRMEKGCCPHCGVPLTTPRGGIPDGAAAYCSNCGGRV